MNLLRKIKLRYFDREPRYARLKVFKDEKLQRELEINGYAVGDKVLSSEQLGELNNIYTRFLAMSGGTLPDTFTGSGLTRNAEAKAYALEALFKITQPVINSFLNQEIASAQPGTLQIKPPTQVSQLDPHQDNAFVDEGEYMGIYTWIPLVDVTEENGAMYMLAGSHRFGNVHRSLNIPWPFMGMADVIMKYAKYVPVKAGQIVFFDSGTIHGSPPNKSDKVRLAVTTVIVPDKAEILNLYLDEETPAGKIEAYEVNADFWNNYDFMKRPPAKFRFVGYRDYKDLKMTKDKLEQLCKQYA